MICGVCPWGSTLYISNLAWPYLVSIDLFSFFFTVALGRMNTIRDVKCTNLYSTRDLSVPARPSSDVTMVQ